MTAARPAWAAELLHFWFHRLKPEQWFRRDARLDAELRRRFAREWGMLATRSPQAFLRDPQMARAAVLLFDQIPRNVFRDDPRAFAGDRLARVIAMVAIRQGWDRRLDRRARQFLYMPLMHSERRMDQHLSVRSYARLGDANVLGFARSHARMVLRFGRFPHRNVVLGRKSTAAEARAIAAGNVW